MKKIASIISYLLHPLLMPMYCMVLIFYTPNYLAFAVHPRLQLFVFGLVFITTFLLPVLSSLFLVYRGEVSSLKMPLREERTMPFFYTACYYVMCYFLMQKLPMPDIISVSILGAAVSILLALLINLKWKISIHMIGIGGVIGLMLGLTHIIYANYVFGIIYFFFLAGLLGTVRIYTTDHKLSQIYAGFFLGVVVEFSALVFIS